MPVSALSTVTVYDPGWTNGRTIPASGIVATAAVNQPGSLSCVLTLDDVARLGRTDLIGAWLWYEHPTQGPFAMIVDDDPSDLDSGTISLSCTSLGHALLMDRSSPVFLQPDTGHAGALARRALTNAQTANPLPFQTVACDESGPQVEVEWRGDPIYDVISDLVNQTGQEFDCTVDSEKNLSFILREQIGADKSDYVLIAEGYHVAGGHIDHSRLSVTNDITGIASNEDFARSSASRIENETSLARYGLRQSIRRYDSAVSPLAVKAKVRADIRAEATAPHIPTITLPAMHPVCNEIRHGDTIRYWSRSRNRELLFRVLSRTVRDGAVLEIAGIAEEIHIPAIVWPFTPDQLSGLRFWLDASDRSTISLAGGNVVLWSDKSPVGGQSVHVATGAIGYTYDAAIRASVVRVVETTPSDGTNLQGTMSLGTTSGATVLAVMRNVSAGAVAAFSYPLAADDFGLGGATNGTGAITAYARSTGGTPSSFALGTSMGSTVYRLISATYDLSLSTNEVTAWLDGVSSGTRPLNGNNAGPMTSSGILFFPGNWAIAEVIIYNSVISTTQREAVESYLRNKWGL